MRYLIAFFIVGFAYCADISAQAYLKTEYIPTSKYRDENGSKNGGKGDMKTIQGGVKIPLSAKVGKNNKPIAWALTFGGSYASMDNKNLPKNLYQREMLNAQAGLTHMRPLSDKWSMMALLGAGCYTSDLNKMSGKSILGQGGVLFIRHAKPNMDWGIGVALNNVLGYPMVFPSLYFDWRLEGKYQFNVSMYNTIEASASMKINDNFKLSLVVEANGLTAVVERNGKTVLFVNQYAYAGLQPEFRIGKSLSIPITIGVSMSREVYYKDRTIKAIFDDNKSISFDENKINNIEIDKHPGFGISAYGSIAIKYGF